MTLTDREKLEEAKPRFYYTDLNNYTREFLQEIIEWQQMYLIAVQDELSVERNTRGKLFCQNRGCEGYFRKVMIK